jgi:hypothetical protein
MKTTVLKPVRKINRKKLIHAKKSDILENKSPGGRVASDGLEPFGAKSYKFDLKSKLRLLP